MITHATLKPRLDCELLAFYGELDAAAAPDLDARRAEVVDSAAAVLIDLCGCTFIDSLGVASVLAYFRAMEDRRRPAALACDSPQVRRILGLTGVDEAVDLYWTRDEAIDALVSSQALS